MTEHVPTEQLVAAISALRTVASSNPLALAYLNRLHNAAHDYGDLAGTGFEEAGHFVLTGAVDALALAELIERDEEVSA